MTLPTADRAEKGGPTSNARRAGGMQLACFEDTAVLRASEPVTNAVRAYAGQ